MASAIAHDLFAHERTTDIKLKDITPFDRMNLRRNVKRGLQKNKFIYPTVIQCTAIPLVAAGVDLLVQSKSGTGKTLIFTIAVLENYVPSVNLPQSLIVAPTREIAVQIEDTLNGIGEFVTGFRAVSCIGGMDVAADRKRLQVAKAVVGTPGRLLHLIQNNVLNTTAVKIFVLDESDKLYTDNFRKDVHRLIQKLPANHQTIACSATYPNELDKELTKIMHDPLFISNSDRNSVLVGVRQFVYPLESQKNSMLEMRTKLDAVRRIFERLSFKQCMIFAGLKSRADSYCNYLQKDGWPCELITGAQSQTTRLETFQKFRKFESRIMIATDVMARGIDSEHVNLVINLELPNDIVTYLHRIGRAGRFGGHGIAINLLTTEQQQTFKNMVASIGTPMSVYNYPMDDETLASVDFWKFEDYHFPYFIKAEIPTELDTLTTAPSESSEQTIDTQTFCINNGKEDPAAEDASKPPALNTPILAVGESLQSSTQHLPISNTIDDASSIKSDSSNHSEHAKHFEIDETENLEEHKLLNASEGDANECVIDCKDDESNEQDLERTLSEPDLLYSPCSVESLQSFKSEDFKFYPKSEHATKLEWLQNFDLSNVENCRKEDILSNLKQTISIYQTLFDIGQPSTFININIENLEEQPEQQLAAMLVKLIESMRADSQAIGELDISTELAAKLELWENNGDEDREVDDFQPLTLNDFKKIRQILEQKSHSKLQTHKYRKKIAKVQKRCDELCSLETKEFREDLLPNAQRAVRRFFKKLSIKDISAEFDSCGLSDEVLKFEFNPEKKAELQAWQDLHWEEDTESSKKLTENNTGWIDSEDSHVSDEDDNDDIQAEAEAEYREMCEMRPNDIKLGSETISNEEEASKAATAANAAEKLQDEENNNQKMISVTANALQKLSIESNEIDEEEDLIQPTIATEYEQGEQTANKAADQNTNEISNTSNNTQKHEHSIEVPTTTKADATGESQTSESFNETKHFPSLIQNAPVSTTRNSDELLPDIEIVLEKQKQLSINMGPQLHISPARSISPRSPLSSPESEILPVEHVSVAGSRSPSASVESNHTYASRTPTSGFDEHTTSYSSGIETSNVEYNSGSSYTDSGDQSTNEDYSQNSTINDSENNNEYDDYDEEDDDEEETERVIKSAEFVDDDYDKSTTDTDDDVPNDNSSDNHNPSTTEYSQMCRAWNDMYWYQRKFVEKYVTLTRELYKQGK